MGLLDFDIYARRATGLARSAGVLDSTFFGLMNNALPVSIWLTLSGFAWFPGGNLFLATLITFLLILFGYSLVWGILGGSMPRSGGSYVYNSRILHPAVGVIISFWNGAFVMLAWICVLSPWFWQVGIPLILRNISQNWEQIFPFSEGWRLYLGTSLVNISAFLVVLGSMKNYFRIQRFLVGISVLGVILVGLIFSRTSHQEFITIWDQFAVSRGIEDFASLVDRTSRAMGGIPSGWNWKSTLGLMLPISWGIIYGYVVTFIAGEIKKPRTTILRSQIITTLISGFFMLWIGLVYQKMLGWEGLHAMAWIAEKGAAGINLPFSLHYLNIASLVVGFHRGIGLILGLSFLAANWLWIVFSYIAWSRAALAWGMDRIGPRWFTRISERYGQPVPLMVIMLIVSQLAMLYFVISSHVLTSLSVGVLQLISVFSFTALSCLLFPFVRKVRHIWNVSPYRDWRVGKLPVASLAGFLALVLTILLMIGFFWNEAFNEFHLWWILINVSVWLIGGLWYGLWKRFRSVRGLDVRKAFREVPPE